MSNKQDIFFHVEKFCVLLRQIIIKTMTNDRIYYSTYEFFSDSPIHPLIQVVPHLAFKVTDLDYELANRQFNVITNPNPPSDGVRVAMIEHNGAPIELIEFNKKS